MSDSLSIPALWYAMRIESVPQSLRPYLAWLSLTIHRSVVDVLKQEEAMKKGAK